MLRGGSEQRRIRKGSDGGAQVYVAVIQAGAAVLAAHRRACERTERLGLIEGAPHGTTCARVGCMASKLLIAAEAATRVAIEPTT